MNRLGLQGLSALGWLSLLAVPAIFFAPGCQGRECESDGYKDYGYGPGEGHLVDQNTWETTPNISKTQPWLAFGPYHIWGLHPVGLEGRDILSVQAYYSADPNPNDPGANFTTGAGNGAEIAASGDSRTIFVTNGTCAPTYLRVVVTADPLPPSSGDLDAAVAAVGAVGTGGADAGTDADIFDAAEDGD
ncbi:MAG: hypothetical protein ABI461_24360 [Polyangiaceae bacterium]